MTGKLVCEWVPATRHDKDPERLVSITLQSGWLEHTTRMPLTLTVLGAHGRTLYLGHTVVKLRKTSPNGVKCGPTCFNGAAMFDPHEKRFVGFDRHQSLARKLEAEGTGRYAPTSIERAAHGARQTNTPPSSSPVKPNSPTAARTPGYCGCA